MANKANETVMPPFTTFNFLVELNVAGRSSPLCSAAFAECSGLEMSMELKTIREGGNNTQPIHLQGKLSYGQLALKRGMTTTFDLWTWFEDVLQRKGDWWNVSAQIVMLGSDRKPVATFILTGCRPVQLRAPALNAKEGQIAIEEMTIAYETMRLEQ